MFTHYFSKTKLMYFSNWIEQYVRPEATADALATEGIENPHDLGEFSKEGLDSNFKNLRYPPKMMTYPDIRGVIPEDLVGVLVDAHPFKISAKSQMRLPAVRKAVKYYGMIHCDLTPANMSWSDMKSFEEK